jgi:hypothetical protein
VQSAKQLRFQQDVMRCHICRNKVATMSEDDFVIEVTDAGASATIPMEAGQVKKGG